MVLGLLRADHTFPDLQIKLMLSKLAIIRTSKCNQELLENARPVMKHLCWEASTGPGPKERPRIE